MPHLIPPDDLDGAMPFGHVVMVHDDGTVSEPDGIYPPTLFENELDDDEWAFFSTGYTGQYGYTGPIMHTSEYIGGRLADDILATPGVYAAVVSSYAPGDDDPEGETYDEGWAIVTRKAAGA